MQFFAGLPLIRNEYPSLPRQSKVAKVLTRNQLGLSLREGEIDPLTNDPEVG